MLPTRYGIPPPFVVDIVLQPDTTNTDCDQIPPKGESIGHCLEDALMFSSVVAHFSLSAEPKTSFAFYEKLRRQPMEQAYVTSSTGWMSNHDLGYLMAKVYELITPVFLWWTRKGMEKEFWDDPRNIDFSAM